MRFGRTSKAVGVAAIAALALSACASTDSGEGNSDPDASGDTGASSGGVVSVAEVNPFTSFNSDSATGNVDINGKVSYLTKSGFNYINDQLEVVPREEFGSYEIVSEDPLTVTYTVNEGVAWSDGEPIDGGDLLFSWAVSSGYFDDADAEAETGTTYFAAASTAGLDLSLLPELGEDGRSITIEYTEPYADWEIAYGVIDTPAHVVATQAGLADEDALIELIQNTPEGDPEDPQERPELQSVADVWNTAFDTTTLPDDPAMYLSSGPYIVDAMVPDQSMTLVKNEDYNWGPETQLDEITIRYIGDATAQVQGLQNGDVDVIQPQASADTLASLEALDGVNIFEGDELSFDHLDLNYSGVFEDENVRKAFMMTIPRDAIVESTIRQLDPEADHRDSHIFDVGTPGYEAATPVNGSEMYDEVDIEGATELLDGATPEVRIMYSVDNPNRVDAYTLIAESAEQAGFVVVDGGLPGNEWGAALGTGTYDAVIFGWVSTGVGVTGVPQLYGCGSASNFSGFCDEEAQAAMDELIVTTDEAEQQELQTIVDTRLFDTGYGLPLFQSIGINAASDSIEGVGFSPTQEGIWWNFWEWTVAE
ncbi:MULTISPECIES: ABC transporter family substrate-binding protein [unclassified Arthrobacter]|uniref:ABC transporter family substrate-binding protein n=1 Tax=unclassified Arthrobacter TaxID=235627 RepID=UPI00149316BE|nr:MULTISPECIES: ABC transporter family substrate-binding protein [unclassified Arthrobacter]MBE0008896.1 ABC transporter family substrate-binding protein [Arthrobacter sp. AET 35A]NOJ62624.1 ABC transporter family substrate-binding protein [Arthrobacter sp. 147(2020)]